MASFHYELPKLNTTYSFDPGRCKLASHTVRCHFITSRSNKPVLEYLANYLCIYALTYASMPSIVIVIVINCNQICFTNFPYFTVVWVEKVWINWKQQGQSQTRRSENDNTPQLLDQSTNSPFIGQQVGNCKRFTLTHNMADLFAMHRGPSSIPLCIQHHIQLTSLSFPFIWSDNVSLTFYRLTSLSFHVNRPSHSWDTTFSKFDLERGTSRPRHRWHRLTFYQLTSL